MGEHNHSSSSFCVEGYIQLLRDPDAMEQNFSSAAVQYHHPRQLHPGDVADARGQRRFILTDTPYLVNYRDREGGMALLLSAQIHGSLR